VGYVSYWVENFIKFRHSHLFHAEDRFCNKIMKCPQEVEVLNRVKQIPCRKYCRVRTDMRTKDLPSQGENGGERIQQLHLFWSEGYIYSD